MEAQIAHQSAQRLLRQRNWLALLAAGLAVTSLVAIAAGSMQPREIVLVPVTGQSLAPILPRHLSSVRLSSTQKNSSLK